MVVIKMVGGLGNQMFQYSLFRKLLEDGHDIYFDNMQTKDHNGFELDKVFNIINRPIESIDILKNLKLISDIWPKFNEQYLKPADNVYLEGNWQHIKYFPDYDILENDFIFKKHLDDKNKIILNDIINSNSVSIHVRRGDYQTKYTNYFFQADWLNYYGIAVNYINKNANKKPLKFFVFSDDIEWCKKNFMINATYVENKNDDSWKDMMLMSNCKHNIIANSTFSWWGAWLNKNIEKIVISPNKWFMNNTDIMSSIIPKNWIRL